MKSVIILMKKRHGFTLTELIMVLAVLVILCLVIVPSVFSAMDRAKDAADQGNLMTLNSVTRLYAFNAGKTTVDVFDGMSDDGARMQALVEGGYLEEEIVPQREGIEFIWDTGSHAWLVSGEEETSLTPLGNTFAEISDNMIAVIRQNHLETGYYGRTWGDYVYTDIGLDPADWRQPVERLYYKPSGATLRVTSEDGYYIHIEVSGERKKVYKGWALVYDDISGKWYYHSISEENEADIDTMEIVQE